PVGEQLRRGDRRRPADEDEEGGLKRIFGVVVVVENPATDAPHHRSMPLDKGRKRRLITTADEVLQQLPIGEPCPIPQKHRPAKVVDTRALLPGRHIASLVATKLDLYLTATGSRPFDPPFLAEARGWPGNNKFAGGGSLSEWRCKPYHSVCREGIMTSDV